MPSRWTSLEISKNVGKLLMEQRENSKVVQGAKKTIFTACHSGKLKLPFTSPDVISTSPKTFWLAELISWFFCYSNSSKNITCPLGKLKTEFTSPIAKSSSPGLSDTYFLCTLLFMILKISVTDNIVRFI